MWASAALAAGAPVVLVLLALLLAALRERHEPCQPRLHYAWRFLQAGAGSRLVRGRGEVVPLGPWPARPPRHR